MVGKVGGARGVVPITLRRASFAFSGILWKRSTCRVSITEGLWLSPLPPPVPSGPPVALLSLPLAPYESRTRACMKHCAQPSSYCCCVITVFLACFREPLRWVCRDASLLSAAVPPPPPLLRSCGLGLLRLPTRGRSMAITARGCCWMRRRRRRRLRSTCRRRRSSVVLFTAPGGGLANPCVGSPGTGLTRWRICTGCCACTSTICLRATAPHPIPDRGIGGFSLHEPRVRAHMRPPAVHERVAA
jgi:hypothetical protein